MASPKVIRMAFGCVIVGAFAFASVARLGESSTERPALLVKAPTGPFKIRAVRPLPPYSGFRVFERLPAGKRSPEVIQFAPDPELPNKKH